MSADTDFVVAGEPMPVIAAVEHLGRHTVRVTWAEGPRAGITEDVDLGEAVLRYRAFGVLRDEGFFRSGQLAENGNVLRWETSRGPVEMAATMVEHAVEMSALDHMPAEAFRAWVDRHGFTYDAAADALGIARRLVAYYLSGEKEIPRTVALACAGYDSITRSAA